MKRLIISALVLFSSVAATAADFDIDAYCSKVSETAADRHQVEQACRKREKGFKEKLGQTSLPSGVERHCTEAAKAVGGSYQAMDDCVQYELRGAEDAD